MIYKKIKYNFVLTSILVAGTIMPAIIELNNHQLQNNNFTSNKTSTIYINKDDNLVTQYAQTYQIAYDFLKNFDNQTKFISNSSDITGNSIDDKIQFFLKDYVFSDSSKNLKFTDILKSILEQNYKDLIGFNSIEIQIPKDTKTIEITKNEDKISINSYDPNNLFNSSDVYVIKALLGALTYCLQNLMENSGAVNNIDKYFMQITSDFSMSIIENHFTTNDHYVKILNNAGSSDSDHFLINNFLNNFLYKIIDENRLHKNAEVTIMKIFNKFFPTIINFDKKNSYINDGTYTKNTFSLLNFNKDTGMQFENITNKKIEGSRFYIGDSEANSYFGIGKLLQAFDDESSTSSTIYNTWFLGSTNIIPDYINNTLKTIIYWPSASATSSNSWFQVFTSNHSDIQNNHFLNHVETITNYMTFMYPDDNNLYKLFSYSQNKIVREIDVFNKEKYNDFTASKIVIIIFSVILGLVILLLIIYRIWFYANLKKQFLKNQHKDIIKK